MEASTTVRITALSWVAAFVMNTIKNALFASLLFHMYPLAFWISVSHILFLYGRGVEHIVYVDYKYCTVDLNDTNQLTLNVYNSKSIIFCLLNVYLWMGDLVYESLSICRACYGWFVQG